MLKTSVIVFVGALLIGAPMVVLGGYFALSEPREIQEAFQGAEIRTGTVVNSVSQRIEYIDGTGEYGKRRSAEVHLIEVTLAGESYPTQVTALVTGDDVTRLHEGDEVELAYLAQGHPVQPLDQRRAPIDTHYVLQSSLDNGPLEQFMWVRGRSWGAAANILIGIGAVVLLFPLFVLLALWNERRKGTLDQPTPNAG